MQAEKDIFTRLSPGLFRPLASANQRLYWQVLVRLFHNFFEEDALYSDHGPSRASVVGTITNVVEQHPNLWVDDSDDIDTADSGVRARANQAYYQLRNHGWLEETRHGYNDYVNMPPRVAQCLSALIELAEGRALIVGGKLKNLRASLREIQIHPESNAESFVEATKEARRFARHLGSIRGSIKSLYDQIRGDIPTRDIVSSFFDDFLREILVRDYATIKTTENPLAIRDELLRIVSHLRYDNESKSSLMRGYQKLYSNEDIEKVNTYLDRDLSGIETVFYNIDQQLDAIDTMKIRYEQRVDMVIEYASRSPRTLGRDITRLAKALVHHSRNNPDIAVRLPLTQGETVGDARFAQPKRPRTPPEPRIVQKTEIPASVLEKSERERAARRAVRIDGETLYQFLEDQAGHRRTLETQELKIDSVQDYFCVLVLQRAARSPGNARKEYTSVTNAYSLSPTNDKIETEMLCTNKIIITRKGQDNHERR